MTPQAPHELAHAMQLLNQGKLSECESLCENTLNGNIGNSSMLHVLALCSRAQGKTEKAKKSIVKALSYEQNSPALLNTYGLILLEQGKAEHAAKIFSKTVSIANDFAGAHANLGHAKTKLGQLQEAEKSYRTAVALAPDLTDAIIQLALLLRSQNRAEELNIDISKVLQNKGPDPGLFMVQGLLCLDSERYQQAEGHFRNGLKLLPQSPVLWANLGLALAKQGLDTDAIAAYETAIGQDSKLAEARINLADILKYDDPKHARRHLEQAISVKPDDKIAWDMIGFTWFMDGNMSEALACYKQALSIDPAYRRAAFHKAGVHFALGQFPEAWSVYGRRYETMGYPESPIRDSLPFLQNGSKIDKQTLIWTDQGLGDEILQMGFIADACERGIPLTLITHDRLKPIANRSFPNIFCIGRSELTTNKQSISDCTAQYPATMLGKMFRKSFDDFPSRASYLESDHLRSQALNEKYCGDAQNSKVIGLSWKSSNSEFGSQKSTSIDSYMPLLSNPKYTFVVLQYGEVEGDLANLPADIQQRIIVDTNVDPLSNMDDFASQVSAMDAVLTTSNTTAHMAGALGVPTWVLVPKIGPGWLWYWFEGQSRSPWYPSVAVHRQSKDGTWTSAITRASSEISSFLE